MHLWMQDIDVAEAWSQVVKQLTYWTTGKNSPWNYAGLILDGFPSVTSHYGFHMTFYHTLLAYSGQQINLPKGWISFNPVQKRGNFPILLPGALGNLVVNRAGVSVVLKLGNLRVDEFRYRNITVPGPFEFTAGNTSQVLHF